MKWKKSLLCIGIGVLLFLAAEMGDSQSTYVENGVLYRNPCGKGDAVYEFFVEDASGRKMKTSLTIPEQKMSENEFRARLPEIEKVIVTKILNGNVSLQEVRADLNLITELSDYGVSVSWKSSMPEIISRFGTIDQDEVSSLGTEVVLEANIICGEYREVVEIPVVIYPREVSWEERFYSSLEQLASHNTEIDAVYLPDRFDNLEIEYHSSSHTENLVLILAGMTAAICLHLKEKSDLQTAKKRREDSLLMDYQNLVSDFMILTGAGYSPKMAWKKMTSDMGMDTGRKSSVLLKEMQITVNQMETGITETRAYADFGKRCGIRCYVRFASLLESSVQTGGKNLRKLLEAEMEEAFRQRADMAKKQGEEASSRLLLPLFGMLGIVMIMVAAPAFLSLG